MTPLFNEGRGGNPGGVRGGSERESEGGRDGWRVWKDGVEEATKGGWRREGGEEGRDTGTGREGFGGDNRREESWERDVGMVGGTRQRDGQSWRGDGRTGSERRRRRRRDSDGEGGPSGCQALDNIYDGGGGLAEERTGRNVKWMSASRLLARS